MSKIDDYNAADHAKERAGVSSGKTAKDLNS